MDKNSLDITWSSKSYSEQNPESWIQYSKDKGKTWEGLATGLRGYDSKIDISTLPPGPVRLRLLVNDGFYTTTSKPVQVNIPDRPPSVAILNPIHGSKLPAGSTLNLWGSVTQSELESVDRKAVQWIIDGKEIAKESLSVFVVAPPEGKHSCKLKLEVGGKIIVESVSFRTISLPDPSEKMDK